MTSIHATLRSLPATYPQPCHQFLRITDAQPRDLIAAFNGHTSIRPHAQSIHAACHYAFWRHPPCFLSLPSHRAQAGRLGDSQPFCRDCCRRWALGSHTPKESPTAAAKYAGFCTVVRCANAPGRSHTTKRPDNFRALKTLLLAAAISLIAPSFSAAAETVTGKVIGVSDGDTIDVLDNSKTTHRVRLAGIDAPEKAQPFGQRSKQHLSDSVFGKQVEVATGKTDRYGRTVGKVLVNGKDANLEQVRSGYAWHYKAYAGEQTPQDRALYSSAETSARSSRVGLWHDPAPMAPWEWRHGGKNEPTPASNASGCPCGGELVCIGSKGGKYCIAPNGNKRYR